MTLRHTVAKECNTIIFNVPHMHAHFIVHDYQLSFYNVVLFPGSCAWADDNSLGTGLFTMMFKYFDVAAVIAAFQHQKVVDDASYRPNSHGYRFLHA